MNKVQLRKHIVDETNKTWKGTAEFAGLDSYGMMEAYFFKFKGKTYYVSVWDIGDQYDLMTDEIMKDKENWG